MTSSLGPGPRCPTFSRASCVQTAVISRKATMQVSRSMYGTRFRSALSGFLRSPPPPSIETAMGTSGSSRRTAVPTGGSRLSSSLGAGEALHERRVFVLQLRVARRRGVQHQEGDGAVALDGRHLALPLRSG